MVGTEFNHDSRQNKEISKVLQKGKKIMKATTTTKLMIAIAISAIVLMTAGIIIISKRPANEVPTSTITCSWETISASTPRPTEAPEPTDAQIEYFGPDANELRDEIDALARVCDAEASVCDENGRRAVIDTVLNRVSSGQFRHTIIAECRSGEFQYSTRDKDEIDKQIFDYAEQELIKWITGEDLVLPADYFYFWGNHGKDENGNPTKWSNYFYNDYDLWENEIHKTPASAYKF